MQFKVRMDKDFQDAWNHYIDLCKLSAKDFYENELAAVGLDSPFKEGTISKLTEEMNRKIFG